MVVADIDEEGGTAVVHEVKDAGAWPTFGVNVTDTEIYRRIVHEGTEQLGGLDFPFNNAIDYGGRESARAT